jgi:hypothetical protein
MPAGRVAGQHVALRLHGSGLRQQPPVPDSLVRPGGAEHEQLGAAVEQGPEQFGEAQVVAGGDAGAGPGQVDRDQLGPGRKFRRLALAEPEPVQFSIVGDKLARWAQCDRGVVEPPVRSALDDRAGVHDRT